MPTWAPVADAEGAGTSSRLRCPLLCSRSSREPAARQPATVSLRLATLLAASSACLAFAAGRLGALPGAAGGEGVEAELLAMEPLPAESLFGELSVDEVVAVSRFVAQELNCSTRFVSLDSCFLSGSETIALKLPSKAAALAHLDERGGPPPRLAEAIVVRGDAPEQFVGIYDVGPLDGRGGLAESASVKLVKKLDWTRRPLDLSDASVTPVIDSTVKKLGELLTESFGPVWGQLDDYKPDRSGQLSWLSSSNVFSSSTHRSSRVWFNWFMVASEFQMNWLHTLPFAFDTVQMGPQSAWRAENISYCGQLFATAEDLLEADRSGKVRRCKDIELTNYTWDVPGPDPGTAAARKEATSWQRYVPEKYRAHAAAVAAGPPVKKTWRITPGGSVVWGDWQLLVTVRPASGLSLHDVRWKGSRVVYELALSDAHAYYSGPMPGKQFHYSDKAYSLMQLSADMVEGLDCPAGATFLDATTWIFSNSNATYTADPALARPMKLACVFESPGYQGSSWRHTQLLNRHVTGRKNRQLVVRAIGTVGNYDYITEVLLGEDGTIKVNEDFAGYPEMDRSLGDSQPAGRAKVSGRALDAKELPDWGSVVHVNERADQAGDNVQLLHSHFALFKVDLDVMGVENDFYVTRPQVVSEGVLPKKVQVTTRVEREDNRTNFFSDPSRPGLWRIVNPKKMNPQTGTPVGYAVQIGSGPALQTLPEDHPFTLGGSFAKRHLTVTVRKDEEAHGVHSLDYYAVSDPIYSIDKFQADEESLVGQDLVCWVSVGKEHVGRAEDQPLVSNFGTSFSIAPWDYYPENPQMQLRMVGLGPEEEASEEFLAKR